MTSTIDPTVPATDSPLTSKPIRDNFQAAYNDINGIQVTLAGLGNLSTQNRNDVFITGGSIAGSTINSGTLANSSIAAMPNNRFLGNVSGISASPSNLSLTQILDTAGFASGDILYRSGTGWQVLAIGQEDYTLTSKSGFPTWNNPTEGGTVTSVSIVTANGISGTVTNPDTTPAITLSLGAITPSSVNASGAILGSNLSGTNTGDQTIILSGDISGTGTSSITTTLATVNANVGSFTNASITVNAKGLITTASNGTSAVTSISGTANRITVTGTTTATIDIAATYVGQSSITTVGTLGSLSVSGTTTLNTSLSGILKAASGVVSQASAGTDYQAPITLTTTGTTGAATFIANTLNIPQYAGGVTSFNTRTGAVVPANGDYTTAQVTESGNLYFTQARAIASPITGYVSGAGTVAATDTILQAIQKLNGNAAALVTGVSSVSNSDGTLTISPTTGAVVASLALAHANTWTAKQIIQLTTQQFTLGYDGSNRADFTVSSTGNLTAALAGTNAGFTFTPSGTGTNTFNSNISAAASPGNIFYNNNAGNTPGCASFLAPNLTVNGAGNGAFFSVGQSNTTNNAGAIQFTYQGGSGSASNYLTFGIYGTNGVLNVFGSSVGIGTAGTAPTAKLQILSTTEQLRLQYDATHYQSITVASTGSTTYSLTGTTPTFTFSQAVNFSATINSNIAQTTLNGTTAGTIIWSQPSQGSSSKEFVGYANGYENNSAVNQTITFTTAFTNTPVIIANSTGLTLTVSTTTLTITAPNSTTTFTGNIIIGGY